MNGHGRMIQKLLKRKTNNKLDHRNTDVKSYKPAKSGGSMNSGQWIGEKMKLRPGRGAKKIWRDPGEKLRGKNT